MIHNLPEDEFLSSGHGACQGCPETIMAHIVLKAAGKNTIVINSTSCLEVVTTPYPKTAWKVPWIHSAFQNASAVASGIDSALKIQNKRNKINILVLCGDGACYSPDTKILTNEGFKWVSEVKERDLAWSVNPNNHELELQPVMRLHSYFYSGKMVCAKTRYVNFCVTPNHSIPILGRKSNEIRIIKAEELLKRYKTLLPRSFKWKGKEKGKFKLPIIKKYRSQHEFKDFKMEDWIQFIGWYVTEGCCYHSDSGYLIRIYQSNKKNRKEILKLMKRMKLPAFECNRSVDVQSKQLFVYLKENCGDYFYNKRIPKEYLNLNKKYLKLLFDTMIKGDGSRQPPKNGRNEERISYITKSQYLLSNFIEISLKIGKNNHIHYRDDGTVTIGVQSKHIKNELYSTRSFGKDKPQVFEENYTGMVYCPELPKNHTLIIEREGKISLSGNSYDIGLASLSGALERKQKFTYICYDTQAYSNTGFQRSSATPFASWTSTTPVGTKIQGKREFRKPITEIIAAHNIPYVATASLAYPNDLYNKVKKSFTFEGPSFINVLSPCTLAWKFDTSLTIDISRKAVESGSWALYEIENGNFKLNIKPKMIPVEEFLKLQGRFSHLTNKDIKIIQEDINNYWKKHNLLF